MHYTPEVTLGTIIEVISLVALGVGGIWRLGKLEGKLEIMYGWFERNVINGNGIKHKAHGD